MINIYCKIKNNVRNCLVISLADYVFHFRSILDLKISLDSQLELNWERMRPIECSLPARYDGFVIAKRFSVPSLKPLIRVALKRPTLHPLLLYFRAA